MPLLVLEGLTKRYGDQLAVESMDLTVEKGEFVSLLGPSGCGKTTTLQMIAGFVDPTAGGIILEGRDLLAVRPSKRGLGIVFQSYALFPHITAAENVAFGLEMRGIAKAERDRQVEEALALVGLSALADRYPRRMSGVLRGGPLRSRTRCACRRRRERGHDLVACECGTARYHEPSVTKPGPSTVTVMMASRIAGIDRKMSTRRMITVSIQPRL